MSAGRWLPPVDLGPFSFGPGGGAFPGGAVHDPSRKGHVAFLAPGMPLPDGWRVGPPPPMDPEEWSRWARDTDSQAG